jgi:hypothetical protein
MATVVKDSLWPGSYHLPDGRTFVCTKAELPHYQTRLKDMLGAGVPIPFNYEHQVDSLPQTRRDIQLALADKCRMTLGWAEGASIHPDGFLEAKLEVPNADDLKRLPSIRYISPTIKRDWTDPNGRFWPGPSIIEFAATSRPVQMRQRAFQLSQDSKGAETWCLSIVQLGDNAMALEDLDKPKGDKMDDMSPVLDDSPPVMNKDDKLSKCLEALAEMKIVLGDDTTMKNFHERLLVALATKSAHENPEPVEPMNEVPTPAMMSLQAQNVRLLSKLAATEKASALSRVKSLAGFLDRPELDRLAKAIADEPISLSASDSPSPTLIELGAYEKAAKIHASRGGFVNMSPTTEHAPPAEWTTPNGQANEANAKAAGLRLANHVIGKK